MTVLTRADYPKHYDVMPAKQLVYKAMVAMPAICLAGLGAKAQIEYDPYEFVTPTPKQNEAILAYTDVVSKSEHAERLAYTSGYLTATRAVGLMWVDGAKSGKLVPLVPVSYDDTSRDGIKAEITQRNQSICSSLIYNANQEKFKGDYANAVSDSLMGIRVAQVLKYSDYPSVMQAGLYERRALKVLIDALPHVPGAQRRQIAAELVNLKPKAERLQQVAGLERFMFIDYLRRMGVDATRIESVRPFASTTVALPTNQFRGSLLASARDDTLPATEQLEQLARSEETDVSNFYGKAILATQAPVAN